MNADIHRRGRRVRREKKIIIKNSASSASSAVKKGIKHQVMTKVKDFLK